MVKASTHTQPANTSPSWSTGLCGTVISECLQSTHLCEDIWAIPVRAHTHTHTKPRAPALPQHHNYIYYSIYGHCSTHTGWSETSLPAPRFIETDADVLSWMGHDCGLRGLTSINTPVERSEISVQISSQTLMYDSVVKPCNFFPQCVCVNVFSANCGTRYDENVS